MKTFLDVCGFGAFLALGFCLPPKAVSNMDHSAHNHPTLIRQNTHGSGMAIVPTGQPEQDHLDHVEWWQVVDDQDFDASYDGGNHGSIF